MEKKRIFLASPTMNGHEMEYIQEAFDTNWVAPLGKNVDEFEKELAAYAGAFSREKIDAAELVIGMKCGGSDGSSPGSEAGRNRNGRCGSFIFINLCRYLQSGGL
jgi:hypothetical protein